MNKLPEADSHSDQRELIARQGLRLAPIILKELTSTGIYCQPTVSIEHQHLARRYVLRGVESGGAVADLGAYCSFIDEQGNRLPWLQRVNSVGANGVHAIVIAPVLVRVQMLRIEHTYDLLVTRHSLEAVLRGKRPVLRSEILFFGRRGSLEMNLWSDDSQFRGAVSPVFYSRSGEVMETPSRFHEALLHLTAGVCCVGCKHCHLLGPKLPPAFPGAHDSDARGIDGSNRATLADALVEDDARLI